MRLIARDDRRREGDGQDRTGQDRTGGEELETASAPSSPSSSRVPRIWEKDMRKRKGSRRHEAEARAQEEAGCLEAGNE